MSNSVPRTGSIKNKIVASDLEEERKNLNFDQMELTEFLYYGKENYAKYQGWIKLVEKEPILANHHSWYDMTREEQMECQLQKSRRMYEIDRKEYFHDVENGFIAWYNAILKGVYSFGLNFTMFMTCIESLADDEQRNQWLPKLKDLKMIGCYAQTELGHGSNVAGIETTATYDNTTDEFVINSPTLTSTKFWPGDMGKISCYSCVYARLISNGKDHGVQPFLVQTRDLATYEPLPGVEMGDIGPKFGYQSKDNGYQIYKNLRIPRYNHLKRFSEVDREGNFKLKGDQRILYSIMLLTRVQIISYAPFAIFQALQIGTRYAVVRRQFSTLDGTKLERKLLDYQTHMYKYAPLLAYAMAFKFSGHYLIKLYEKVMDGVKNNDFSQLELLHHLSSGYKAVYTKITYDAIDDVRQSCGGAGFLQWSALPQYQQDYAPNPTFEGDNTVMLQQCSRLIVKTVKGLAKGKKAEGNFSYLNNILGLIEMKSTAKTVEDVLSVEFLETALAVRSAFKVKSTVEDLMKSKASENQKANSEFAIDIISMSTAHVMYTTFYNFKNGLSIIKCNSLKNHLNNLLRLYSISELIKDNQCLYESGFFSSGIMNLLNQALKQLLKTLRPFMIPIVEAIQIPDVILTSSIGNSYGDIYETQLEWAKSSRLNKSTTIRGFKENILPIVNGKL
ncbi:acyl-coenzyme a oxidase [Stylonychia lemnae]|uniref:Acyl-coenzyme A oxidase n=1 Tax=Stylonychia lemnae TaxID=5949 RepID=A0A078A2K3_STYLE|nr:acyl-coenzyme a oxidase [Stylonychia lemnae]|eukprot:CDW75768.1 acyl-coenzyme a oxidase [Stylonychia lemnae]